MPFTHSFFIHVPKRVAPSALSTRIQIRSARTRRSTSYLERSIQQDERLLRHLEAELEAAKARITREEEEEANLLLKHNKNRGSKQSAREFEGIEDHHAILWETALSQKDRQVLKTHGVDSMDDLSSVYHVANEALENSPSLKPEDLDPKLKCAYDIFESIPSKLRDAKFKKGKT
ncbi:hypothetical protein AMATHDRAFT_56722 [Amanita thiersii Skay4041]|uniref:Uncharacterized protein n=1 Tax=Amanita thiersii Skay4041 TaxID=703135 RepID=A0A2A9NWH1_9AGAR|nr:hypothetical protein AMATHDRAFT_56722 [Amanita thiersii Skay4041]